MVHVQTHRPVEVSERLTGNWPRVASVPNKPADDRAILLFYPSLVVLAVCPGTGELDVLICSSSQEFR